MSTLNPKSLPHLSGLHLNASGIAQYPAASSFGPRILSDYEFVWIVRGASTAYFDGKKLSAPADSLLLGKPGVRDSYDWAPKSRTVHAYLHFSFRSSSGWPLPKTWPCYRQLGKEDLLKSLFRFCLLNSETNGSSLVRDALELMLKLFISGSGAMQEELQEEFPAAVERALGHIHQSLQGGEELTHLSQLAKRAAVASEHLCRLFKKTLGVGPMEYLRLLRLERAATLLSRSNMNVNQISDSLLFSNPFHFSRAFKAVYRLSPRAYRQAILSGKATIKNPLALDHLKSLSSSQTFGVKHRK